MILREEKEELVAAVRKHCDHNDEHLLEALEYWMYPDKIHIPRDFCLVLDEMTDMNEHGDARVKLLAFIINSFREKGLNYPLSARKLFDEWSYHLGTAGSARPSEDYLREVVKLYCANHEEVWSCF